MADSLLEEEFSVIPGYPEYAITRTGVIRSNVPGKTGKTWVGRILSTRMDHDGYETACLYQRGKKNGTYLDVHYLVMATFVGPRPEKLVINHLDGDRSNNTLSNLEYCTVSQNMLHAHKIDPELKWRMKEVSQRGRLTPQYQEAFRKWVESDACANNLRKQAKAASIASKTPEAIEKWRKSREMNKWSK